MEVSTESINNSVNLKKKDTLLKTRIPILKLIRLFLATIVVIIGSLLTILRGLIYPFHPKNTQFFNTVVSPLLFKILNVKVTTEGKENLTPGCPAIFIGNHQSNLDMFVYGTLCIQGGVSVGKDNIKWIPFFGQAYWLAGNILIKRRDKKKSKESMIECKNAILNKGTSIFIFPEGTRNYGKGLKTFKKGPYYLAIDTKAPLVPISINTYSKNGLDFNSLSPINIHIRIHPKIESGQFNHEDNPSLMTKTREIIESGIKKLDS